MLAGIIWASQQDYSASGQLSDKADVPTFPSAGLAMERHHELSRIGW
jgi:hypothetical protein